MGKRSFYQIPLSFASETLDFIILETKCMQQS
jgi:hypothetical protein